MWINVISSGAMAVRSLAPCPFEPPYSNNQAVFAISGSNVIVNPSGPGVSSDADATLNVTIVATQ
jgi:hypothetical protein